jgi:hypothetical protein
LGKRASAPKIPRKGTSKSKPLPTTIEMELSISELFGIRKNIIVPNISWGFDGIHECDLFIIKQSMYAIEVEIKRSISDLKADFKKKHGHVDPQNRIHELYYAVPIELYDVAVTLIPEDAGIIASTRMKSGILRSSIVKKPKRIKGARKLTTEEQYKVARLGTMRIWSLKKKIIKLTK